MKFTLLTTFLATSISALPTQTTKRSSCPAQPPKPDGFQLMALRSASPIHFAPFSAILNSISLWQPAGTQNAVCEGGVDNSNRATFYLKDGGLFLYDARMGRPQQLYVDRSGMGHGRFGYIYSDQSPPRYGELIGWAIDEEQVLNFKGKRHIACPSSDEADQSWSVWIDAGNPNPGFNEGCLGFSARVAPVQDAVNCVYSVYSS